MRMNKIDTYIKLLIICITFIGCIFLSSNLFMDSQNTPKQICGRIGVISFILYNALSMLFKFNSWSKNYIQHIVICIVSVVSIEAVYGTTSFIYDLYYITR